MNIKELSLEQLKALAYDEMAKIDFARKNLEILNLEISSRNKVDIKNEK